MGNCSECTYLKVDDPDLYGKYWCTKRLERVAAYETCYRFCKDSSKSSYDSKYYENYSKDHSGSPGCYLTTIMCKILDMDDDNPYLTTMRNFRNNVLQKNNKYKELLVEYDTIGPKIANNLENDPLKSQIAFDSLFNYIVPITDLIKKEEYDKAIELYKSMTNKLKTFYNLNNTISVNDIENADIKESGHGIYKTKKIV